MAEKPNLNRKRPGSSGPGRGEPLLSEFPNAFAGVSLLYVGKMSPVGRDRKYRGQVGRCGKDLLPLKRDIERPGLVFAQMDEILDASYWGKENSALRKTASVSGTSLSYAAGQHATVRSALENTA